MLSQVWAGAVTPISDLVPADEIKHWANTNENMYDGKLWAAPLYLMGIPLAYNKDLFKKAGLDPENPPKTWDEFLKACETLKKAGITPMAGGAAKASAFGAWIVCHPGRAGPRLGGRHQGRSGGRRALHFREVHPLA